MPLAAGALTATDHARVNIALKKKIVPASVDTQGASHSPKLTCSQCDYHGASHRPNITSDSRIADSIIETVCSCHCGDAGIKWSCASGHRNKHMIDPSSAYMYVWSFASPHTHLSPVRSCMELHIATTYVLSMRTRSLFSKCLERDSIILWPLRFTLSVLAAMRKPLWTCTEGRWKLLDPHSDSDS